MGTLAMLTGRSDLVVPVLYMCYMYWGLTRLGVPSCIFYVGVDPNGPPICVRGSGPCSITNPLFHLMWKLYVSLPAEC